MGSVSVNYCKSTYAALALEAAEVQDDTPMQNTPARAAKCASYLHTHARACVSLHIMPEANDGLSSSPGLSGPRRGGAFTRPARPRNINRLERLDDHTRHTIAWGGSWFSPGLALLVLLQHGPPLVWPVSSCLPFFCSSFSISIVC